MIRTFLIAGFLSLSYSNADATTLGLGTGTVKVVTKTDDVCADGPYTLMGEKDDQVLMVGPNLTLYPPADKKQILSTASETECAEDVVSTLKEDTLTNVFSTHSCPAKSKNLERVVTETLSVSKKDKAVTYIKVSTDEKRVKCVFKWGPSEKK